MHPLVAVLAVFAATGGSIVLIRYVYGLETRHTPSPRVLVMIGTWFLVTYGLMAFAIRPA